MPATADFGVARTRMPNHTSAGVEGVVAKHLDHPYRANIRDLSSAPQSPSLHAVAV
jgi:hypothetical protein